MQHNQTNGLIKAIVAGNPDAIENAKAQSGKKIYTTYKEFFFDIYKSACGGPEVENYELQFNAEETAKMEVLLKHINAVEHE